MVQNNRGFTLIELAIVMVIVGLLAGFGASMIVPLSVRAKRMETTEAVNVATEAVIGYAAAHNGRLPTVGEFPGIIGKYKDAWRKPL
ncbi:MAG: type II secretion system GspH family protein, partial [Proteobacteria bacterium]|nr:type II secretion system GspH family protein [Pseudomonadota bacterium]